MNSTPLNLFPIRVAIGKTADADGAGTLVYMTPEFERALAALLVRVGGPAGLGTEDLGLLSGDSPPSGPATSDPLQALPLLPPSGPTVADLARAVDELRLELAQARAEYAELQKGISGLELVAGFTDPFRVNWERPGAIGSLTASTGAFTNLSYSGTLTGGAGVITIGTNQLCKDASGNVGIGTASPGSLLDVRGQVRATASGFQVDSAGSLLVKLFYSGGARIDRAAGTSFSIMLNGSTQCSWDTGAGLTNVGGFGCNGKSAQTAFALGAAATDLPTVITLANNLRTLAINNGTGS